MMDNTEMEAASPSGSSSIGEAVSGRGQNVAADEEDLFYIPERRPSLDLGPNPMEIGEGYCFFFSPSLNVEHMCLVIFFKAIIKITCLSSAICVLQTQREMDICDTLYVTAGGVEGQDIPTCGLNNELYFYFLFCNELLCNIQGFRMRENK